MSILLCGLRIRLQKIQMSAFAAFIYDGAPAHPHPPGLK